MSKIYIVTWTTYLDDYKLRGSDPSSSIEPVLFSKKEYAKEYLASIIRDYLEECEYQDKHVKKVFPECVDEEGDVVTKIDRYGYNVVSFDQFDYVELKNMLERVNKGEFVPQRVSWAIKEQAIDTMRVSKKKHKATV